jgi:hypothetical protein
MFESVRLGVGSEQIRVFVSYDREHDSDLHDQLVEQASKTSGFEISARSRAWASADFLDEGLRREIREADEVIIICGEHTDRSERVGTELRIAREEERPYLLLWGRRELMCTKPTTARNADSMYSWTWEILQSQIVSLARGGGRPVSGREPTPGRPRRSPPQPSSPPSPPDPLQPSQPSHAEAAAPAKPAAGRPG